MLGFSYVYREMAFGSISGCIGSDVAHVVNAGVHQLSGFPRFVDPLDADVVGERWLLPEY